MLTYLVPHTKDIIFYWHVEKQVCESLGIPMSNIILYDVEGNILKSFSKISFTNLFAVFECPNYCKIIEKYPNMLIIKKFDFKYFFKEGDEIIHILKTDEIDNYVFLLLWYDKDNPIKIIKKNSKIYYVRKWS